MVAGTQPELVCAPLRGSCFSKPILTQDAGSALGLLRCLPGPKPAAPLCRYVVQVCCGFCKAGAAFPGLQGSEKGKLPIEYRPSQYLASTRAAEAVSCQVCHFHWPWGCAREVALGQAVAEGCPSVIPRALRARVCCCGCPSLAVSSLKTSSGEKGRTAKQSDCWSQCSACH